MLTEKPDLLKKGGNLVPLKRHGSSSRCNSSLIDTDNFVKVI